MAEHQKPVDELKTVDEIKSRQSVSIGSAKNLSTTTNTPPQIPSVTPRWLLRMLPWTYVDSGIYRVNKVRFVVDTHEKISFSYDEKRNVKLDLELLRSIYLFKFLSDDALQQVMDNIKQKDVKIGDVIIEEGVKDEGMFYIVLEGEFDVNILGRHKKNSIVATLSEGDFFGEMVLIKDIPRQATVIATTEGILLCLNKKSFGRIIKDKAILEEIERAYKDREKGLELINEYGEIKASVKSGHYGEPSLPHGHIEYDLHPKELHLSIIQSIVGIHTRISDIYNVPFNQLEQQMRVTIENMREREEWEIINNKEFGLLANAAPNFCINTRQGPPTPDDLDDLLALVWKKPSFFLAHPKAIAAFGRECTRRGVPPPTVDIFGTRFLTWRGIPLVPTNKMQIEEQKNTLTTNILCVRVGEENQGVIGLYKGGDKNIPGLTVHYMGINDKSIANYLVTKYFSVAILVPDAVGVLKSVEIGNYYNYE